MLLQAITLHLGTCFALLRYREGCKHRDQPAGSSNITLNTDASEHNWPKRSNNQKLNWSSRTYPSCPMLHVITTWQMYFIILYWLEMLDRASLKTNRKWIKSNWNKYLSAAHGSVVESSGEAFWFDGCIPVCCCWMFTTWTCSCQQIYRFGRSLYSCDFKENPFVTKLFSLIHVRYFWLDWLCS